MPLWALACAGFALALGLSYRAIHQPHSADLRTPLLVLLDAGLATAVALLWRARQAAPAGGGGGWWALAYGLCAAAAFRLVPPMLSESVLYYANTASPDAPYVLLGAVLHGGIALIPAMVYARHVVGAGREPVPMGDDEVWQLGAITMVLFLAAAAVVRLLAEVAS